MASEYDALLAEPPKSEYDALLTPEAPPRVEEIKPAPTVMGELGAGRIGSAAGLAKNEIENLLSPSQPTSALQVHGESGRSLLGTTERIPSSPDDSTLSAAGKAVVNVGNQTMAGLTSPEMLPLLPIAGAEATVGKVLAAAFGGQMATAVPGQVIQAIHAPTLQEKLEGGLGAGLSTLFAVGGLGHATGLTAKLFPSKPEVPDPITTNESPIVTKANESLDQLRASEPVAIQPTQEITPNEIQKPSAGEDVQRQPEPYGGDGGQRLGDEQIQQGNEVAQTQNAEPAAHEIASTIEEANKALGANEYGNVKFQIAGPGGPMNVSGKVTRVFTDGRIELKTQNNGYHTIEPPGTSEGVGGAILPSAAGEEAVLGTETETLGPNVGARKVRPGQQDQIDSARLEMRNAVNKTDYANPADKPTSIADARERVNEAVAGIKPGSTDSLFNSDGARKSVSPPEPQALAPATESVAPPETAPGQPVGEIKPGEPAPESPDQKMFADFQGYQAKQEGPSQAAIGIVPRSNEFVRQDVAKAIGGGVKAVQQIKALLTPANVSELSGVASRVIRENAAQLAREKEMAGASLQEAAKLVGKNDPATNLDIINRLETGKSLADTGLDAYKQARQAGYDSRIEQVRALNPNAMQNLIQDYFPHIWTKESIDKVAGNLDAIPAGNAWASIFGKKPLEGPKGFLKQRSVPTTAEGIAIGLEPVTTNPVMLDLLKMHEMDRYVMGQKIKQEFIDNGTWKFVREGDKAEPGYVQINDRIANVSAPRDWKVVNAEGKEMPGQTTLGHYYAPEDAARVVNNYLSPGLRGFAPYDAFRFVGNMMNQVQLGVSMYHATFTTIDAATSTLSLGLEQIARSGGSPKELTVAAGNIARAFAEAPVGGALIENLWRGNKFLREYSKPGTTNAELAKIVDAAVAGGARVKMDTFYNTGAVNSFFDALKSGNYAGAVLRAPFALFQAAAKPLMEYTVPRMKLGIISQNLEYDLGKLEQEANKTGATITRDDIRKVAARTVDSVDNRMGQLIYDNLFWNKVLKDTLMGSVRSVGWNLGDIREIGGGLLDTVTAPKRAYDALTKGSQLADNPVVTKRMTYAVALPLMVGVLGSMYQYLMTGEGPKDLMDVYMPRTGRKKADGSDERVMLPTYMKDIAPLALAASREGAVGLVKRSYSMALNKMHPAVTTFGQMTANQDYYGNQIRNADDGLVSTIQKEIEFVAKNFRPFSVQGVIQREGGLKEKAQAVIGLMPAPRALTDSPAMRLMHDINAGKRPAGGYDAAQQQKRADKRAAQQGQDLRPEIFKRLSKDDKARVLELATPEEKAIFQSGSNKLGL
jgi:hypothetical protein